MPGRLEYERAIRRSSLPALARHICLTLATWADITTGVIPPQYQPSQQTLLSATGMAKPTLLKYMKTVTLAGWVGAEAPSAHDARTKHARTQYTILIPPGSAVPEELGQQVTQAGSGGDPAPGEAGSPADRALGQQVTQARSPADPELGQGVTPRVPSPSNPNQSPRAGASESHPIRVAAERTGVERKPRRSDPGQGQMPLLLPVQSEPPASVHHQLAEQMTRHYGVPVTVRHAAAVALAVLDGRRVANPIGYVMTAVERDPTRHRPTSLPPAYRAPERRAASDS